MHHAGWVSHRRLPYLASLDSLRATAVIAVLLYHHDPDVVPGGWLGVSLFFTLSGFLITNTLLSERSVTGSIDLGGFWARRVRRLVPASLAAVGLVGLGLVSGLLEVPDGAGGDIRAALLNVANWRFIATDAPYADASAVPSPVQHYWSLAIEEQFYVVLPLVVMVGFVRRRLLVTGVVAIVAGSAFLQHRYAEDLDRVYFGTDTRAGELAVGVVLALALPALRDLTHRHRSVVDAMGITAAVAAAVLVLTTPLDGRVTSGALVAVGVVWVTLIGACVLGRRFSVVAEIGPLPAIGRVSYGIYLYHWPIYLVLTPDRVGVPSPALFALRASCTVALAGLSAVLLERPVLRRRVRPHVAIPLAFASIATVVVASILVGAPGPGAQPATIAGAQLVPPPDPVPAAVAPSTVPDATPPSTDASRPETATPTTVPAAVPASTAPARRMPRLLVVGDSTVGGVGVSLQRIGAAEGIADVTLLFSPGCTVLDYEVAIIRPGFEYTTRCRDVIGSAAEQARAGEFDAVVVLIGSLQLTDARYPDLEGFRSILDAEVGARYRTALDARLSALDAARVPVLWADVPVPEWNISAMGEVLGGELPGTGPATTDDPRRAAELNAIDDAVIARHPNAVRWGYTAALAGPDGVIDDDVRYDGLHLTDEASDAVARAVAAGALPVAYRSVWAHPAADIVAREPNQWDP